MFPDANDQFADVRLVDAIAGDRDESLRKMREEMLQSQRFEAAVFIGGMEGVLEEAAMFAELYPEAAMIPVASTGAAASEVYWAGAYPTEFQTELTYPTLFRHYLPIEF